MKNLTFAKFIVVIGLLFADLFAFNCAKSFGNENHMSEDESIADPVTVVVELKKDSKIRASIKRKPNLDYSTELDSENELPEFYAKFKDVLTAGADSEIIIESDSSITIGKYITLTKQAREAGAKQLYLKYQGKIIGRKLETSENEILETISETPNPLTLVIDLDEKGNLSLNGESCGKVSDLVPLEAKLKEVFAHRRRNEAELKKLTNQPLTTVYLQVSDRTTPFDENMKEVIESLKKSGAEPIKDSLKSYVKP